MNIKQQITNYFREILAVELEPSLWQPARRLPIYLRDGYVYYAIDLLDDPFLIMADEEDERSAATIKKHIDQVKNKWDSEVIYAKSNTNSDERRRLIEQKIPFVIPGNQLYLPTLGIDLREYFRKKSSEVEKFSPATQAVLLLLLTEESKESYSSQDLTNRLHYSKMTISRSLNDLKSIDAVSKHGRARILEFDGEKRELWERSLPYLDSPVKQTHFVRTETKRPRITSGLTALAKYSMLAPPKPPMFAMTQEEWRELESRGDVTAAKPTDPRATGIEVWSYSPALFAKDNHVDRLSLYLSLRDDPDERVEEALEEMMKGVSW